MQINIKHLNCKTHFVGLENTRKAVWHATKIPYNIHISLFTSLLILTYGGKPCSKQTSEQAYKTRKQIRS